MVFFRLINDFFALEVGKIRVFEPVGGGGLTLDATDAAAMTRQIEPRAVVPVHFKDDALAYEMPQDAVDTFVKELGAGVLEAGPKFKVKNDASIPEQMTVILLTRS